MESEPDNKSSESEEHEWTLDERIYGCLGPAAGDVVAQARRKPKYEARDFIYECLGPAVGDVLSETRGKIFDDDSSNSSSSESEEEEEEESDAGSKWSIESKVYHVLGPGASDLLACTKGMSREEARDFIIDKVDAARQNVENNLSSCEVFTETRGKVFKDDSSCSSSSSSDSEEQAEVGVCNSDEMKDDTRQSVWVLSLTFGVDAHKQDGWVAHSSVFLAKKKKQCYMKLRRFVIDRVNSRLRKRRHDEERNVYPWINKYGFEEDNKSDDEFRESDESGEEEEEKKPKRQKRKRQLERKTKTQNYFVRNSDGAWAWNETLPLDSFPLFPFYKFAASGEYIFVQWSYDIYKSCIDE